MDKKELDFIIQEGEGLKIEFKENLSNIEKEMVAFANTSGGRIFIGIGDSGLVKGIKVTNKLKSQVQDIANNCDPSIRIGIDLFEFENKDILITNVFEGDNKPYQCSSGFYLRQGPNSQKLKRDEIISFSIEKGKIKFDEQTNKKFDFKADFDQNKFKNYLKLAKIKTTLSIQGMLLNLGLCNENFQYNNACVLFFSKTPEKYFLTSKVVCANYQGNEKVKILDKKVFDEGIINNIIEAVNYVKKHINIEYKIKKLEREEILQYPEEAIRETIVNAIMHRDYFDSSGDILVEVFRNKLVISNPGGLVKSLRPEDFGKISRTRNSLIANLLSRTEFVEKLGTGINRIRRAIKKAGLPEPVFDYNGSFLITLYDKTRLEATKKATKRVGGGVSEGVSEGVNRLLEYIKNNPGKRVPHFKEALRIPAKTIERWLNNLKKKGKIEFKGSPKTGGYFVK